LAEQQKAKRDPTDVTARVVGCTTRRAAELCVRHQFTPTRRTGDTTLLLRWANLSSDQRIYAQ